MKMRGITGKWKHMWHSSPPDLGVAEVVDDVGRPLVGLGQQHPAGVVARRRTCGTLLAGSRGSPGGSRRWCPGARRGRARRRAGSRRGPCRARTQIASSIASWTCGVVEVEVGLVGEEAVPEVLLAHRVPGPVRRLGVDEDDPGVLVELVGVGPDVEVAVGAVGVAARLAWNHGCCVAGVVHDEVDDHADAALVRLVEERRGSPRACRTRAGCRCSRRRRSRRRAAAR